VCGTRPEAIKLAPLVRKLRDRPGIDVTLCATGQHREMLYPVFDLFGLTPDIDLQVMQPGQSLTNVTCAILTGLEPVFEATKPQIVVVHGDTNTTLSASLAAFYAQVPVAHVEAGLRTGNMLSPWPEEANRSLTGVLAARHYAPTAGARQNLLNENVAEDKILITGNTVIDALQETVAIFKSDTVLEQRIRADLPTLDPARKLILVTGHRRENFGDGFEAFFSALKALSERDDVQIIFPVHLNPQVREPVFRLLADCQHVHLIEPLGYLPFAYLMSCAYFIISDSGGIQEEAPALGVPVLVTRDTTERPEAIEAGTARPKNPFGDGTASEQIAQDLANWN